MGQLERAPKKSAPAKKPAVAGKAKAAPAAAEVVDEPEEDPVQTALARYGIIMSNPWDSKKMCAAPLPRVLTMAAPKVAWQASTLRDGLRCPAPGLGMCPACVACG